MTRTRLFLVLMIVCCFGAASPGADLRMQSELAISGLPNMEQAGLPPVDTVELWIADSVVVSIAATAHVIMDHKTGEMTIIMHDQRAYMTVPLPDFDEMVKPAMDTLQQALDSLRGELAAHPEKMDSLLAEMEGDSASQALARNFFESMLADSNASLMKLKVTPGDETKMILGFNTQRYDMTMTVMGMKMTGTMWATEEIDLMNKFMYDWMQMSQGLLAGMGMEADDLLQEMLKIKGSVIASSMSMEIAGMQMKMENNLVSLDTTSTCPPELLTVPEGYEQMTMPTPEVEAQ